MSETCEDKDPPPPAADPEPEVPTETPKVEGEGGEESSADKKVEEGEAPKPPADDETPTPPPPPPAASAPVQPAVPPEKKIRYDWYQTERDVCVNIMIKKLSKSDVKVVITERTVSVTINREKYKLELNLAHPIDQKKSTSKVLSTKVEIRLRKSQGLQWQALEAAAEKSSQPTPNVNTKSDDPVHKYPSSSHYTRDWDKLVAEVKDEEKNEKPEGDAALNKLFQQIYRDGNDEVRKAMNKSFVESGGTVLSTNWEEIGKEKVERKPPDGMEWKQYEN